MEECVMVGDTPDDIFAAVAAGARPVGVLAGDGSLGDKLRAAGAEVVLNHPRELAAWILARAAQSK
jgi:phosphoglycolate phosphatase-like HAD superfamily hydrolase